MLKQQSLKLLFVGCVAHAIFPLPCTNREWNFRLPALRIADPRRLSDRFHIRMSAHDSSHVHDVSRKRSSRKALTPASRRSLLMALMMNSFLASPSSRIPAAAMVVAPSSAAKVLSLVESGMPRSDPELLAAVEILIQDATPPVEVDFADAAGTWRVVAAPLIDTLSRLALTKFDIQYRIGAKGNVGAYVRYNSKIVGDGWLCTDGPMANVVEASTPTVKLVWERIWWQPGGRADAPPIDPDAEDAAFLRPLVQALGRLGFSEELARFPVRFLDTSKGLAIFQWKSLTAVVQRVS